VGPGELEIPEFPDIPEIPEFPGFPENSGTFRGLPDISII